MSDEHAQDVAKVRRGPSTHATAKRSIEEILSAARVRGRGAKPTGSASDLKARVDGARQRFSKQ